MTTINGSTGGKGKPEPKSLKPATMGGLPRSVTTASAYPCARSWARGNKGKQRCAAGSSANRHPLGTSHFPSRLPLPPMLDPRAPGELPGARPHGRGETPSLPTSAASGPSPRSGGERRASLLAVPGAWQARHALPQEPKNPPAMVLDPHPALLSWPKLTIEEPRTTVSLSAGESASGWAGPASSFHRAKLGRLFHCWARSSCRCLDFSLLCPIAFNDAAFVSNDRSFPRCGRTLSPSLTGCQG